MRAQPCPIGLIAESWGWSELALHMSHAALRSAKASAGIGTGAGLELSSWASLVTC